MKQFNTEISGKEDEIIIEALSRFFIDNERGDAYDWLNAIFSNTYEKKEVKSEEISSKSKSCA